jgi:N-acetylglutamate synthase
VHQPRYTIALTPADVGERLMVRYALADEAATREGDVPALHEPPMTDAVGDLMSWDDKTLLISTRTGTVEVLARRVGAGKRVPAARLAAARDVSIAELQRISAKSWQALETERVGGWRLRASGGFTGRANSVLPLGQPGLPFHAALGYVESWYAERGLAPLFQLPLPFATDVADQLDARGWRVRDSTHVMVGDIAATLDWLGEPRRPLPRVTILDVPTPAWLSAYHYRGSTLPPAGYQVLTHHERAGFATVTEGGHVLAIARGAVDDGWVGLAAIEVDAAHRRQGLGRHVVGGLLRWAQEQGARHAHLQVAADNHAGRALYDGLGFTYHHRYDYRMAP